jgi:hypothetical protein
MKSNDFPGEQYLTEISSIPMAFEKFDFGNLDKERRKAIAKSIRTISPEELKKLMKEMLAGAH